MSASVKHLAGCIKEAPPHVVTKRMSKTKLKGLYKKVRKHQVSVSDIDPEIQSMMESLFGSIQENLSLEDNPVQSTDVFIRSATAPKAVTISEPRKSEVEGDEAKPATAPAYKVTKTAKPKQVKAKKVKSKKAKPASSKVSTGVRRKNHYYGSSKAAMFYVAIQANLRGSMRYHMECRQPTEDQLKEWENDPYNRTENEVLAQWKVDRKCQSDGSDETIARNTHKFFDVQDCREDGTGNKSKWYRPQGLQDWFELNTPIKNRSGKPLMCALKNKVEVWRGVVIYERAVATIGDLQIPIGNNYTRKEVFVPQEYDLERAKVVGERNTATSRASRILKKRHEQPETSVSDNVVVKMSDYKQASVKPVTDTSYTQTVVGSVTESANDDDLDVINNKSSSDQYSFEEHYFMGDEKTIRAIDHLPDGWEEDEATAELKSLLVEEKEREFFAGFPVETIAYLQHKDWSLTFAQWKISEMRKRVQAKQFVKQGHLSPRMREKLEEVKLSIERRKSYLGSIRKQRDLFESRERCKKEEEIYARVAETDRKAVQLALEFKELKQPSFKVNAIQRLNDWFVKAESNNPSVPRITEEQRLEQCLYEHVEKNERFYYTELWESFFEPVQTVPKGRRIVAIGEPYFDFESVVDDDPVYDDVDHRIYLASQAKGIANFRKAMFVAKHMEVSKEDLPPWEVVKDITEADNTVETDSSDSVLIVGGKPVNSTPGEVRGFFSRLKSVTKNFSKLMSLQKEAMEFYQVYELQG